MFICDYCSTSIGPSIKPIKVVMQTRPREYHFDRYDPETETSSPCISQGSEIEAEFKQCAECAGVILPVSNKATHQHIDPFGHASLGSMVLESMMSRTLHNTQRSKDDFAAAYGVLKEYEQRGGGI